MSIRSAQWQRQLAGFTQKIEQLPSDPSVYLDRGHFFLQHGQVDLAIVDYSMAIALNPNHFESYNSRGVAYSEKRQFAPALQDLNQAIKLSPDTPIIYVNRGIVSCLNFNYYQGIFDYNHAIVLWMELYQYPQQRQRWRSYHNRAVAYRQLDIMDKSLADMVRALTLAPDQTLLHLDMAQLLRQGDTESLREFFSGELSEEDILELARLHQNFGQADLALEKQIKLYHYLLNGYAHTPFTTLIASLRSHTKQLLRRRKKGF